MLERTLIPKFTTTFSMIRALRWMPIIKSITFGTCALLEGEAHWLPFFSRRTRTFRGSFSQRKRIVFHSTLLSSRALTFSRPTVCNLQRLFFLCASTSPWMQQRQRRVFQVVFQEKRKASHEFSVRSTEQPSFQSGVVSSLTFLNST